MKKYFLLLTALCLCYIKASTQIGIRVGANFSDLKYVTDVFSPQTKIMKGFQGGVFYDKVLNDLFDVRASVVFNIKGALGNSFEGDNSRNVFQNIDFGADFIYSAYKLDKINFRIFLGPQLGLGLKAFSEYEGVKDHLNYKRNGLSRLDLGLNVGLIVEFGNPFIGFNYNYGLSNLRTFSGSDFKIKHRVFSVIAGYKF